MATNRTVTVLPARKHIRKDSDEEKPKLRVAAYCRVSTDSDEQATSYDAQIEHYTAYINGQEINCLAVCQPLGEHWLVLRGPNGT